MVERITSSEEARSWVAVFEQALKEIKKSMECINAQRRLWSELNNQISSAQTLEELAGVSVKFIEEHRTLSGNIKRKIPRSTTGSTTEGEVLTIGRSSIRRPDSYEKELFIYGINKEIADKFADADAIYGGAIGEVCEDIDGYEQLLSEKYLDLLENAGYAIVNYVVKEPGEDLGSYNIIMKREGEFYAISRSEGRTRIGEYKYPPRQLLKAESDRDLIQQAIIDAYERHLHTLSVEEIFQLAEKLPIYSGDKKWRFFG